MNKFLLENAWKAEVQKNKLKDTTVLQALVAYPKTKGSPFDARLAALDRITKAATALKKSKEILVLKDVEKYLGEMIKGTASELSEINVSDQAATMASKSVLVSPLGKIDYFAGKESQVLPLLKVAIKAFSDTWERDRLLDDKFQAVEAFRNKIPADHKIIQAEFLKINASVKLDAKALQGIKNQVKIVKPLLDLVIEEAESAQDDLVITQDDLQSADDTRRAEELKKDIDSGPLATIAGLIAKVNTAATAWEEVEKNPIESVSTAVDACEAFLDLFNIDQLNQIASLEQDAEDLKLKSLKGRFKEAKKRLVNMQKLGTQIRTVLSDATQQYNELNTDLPADFDKANKQGKFHFKNLSDLAKMLTDYKAFADSGAKADGAAYNQIGDTIKKLGDGWSPDFAQASDILTQMFHFALKAMNRAADQRDSVDPYIKQVNDNIKELEEELSKMRLYPD